MYKSRLFFTILAILFFVYWLVLFPLLWVYLTPVIVEEDLFEESFWIPVIFWCSAFLIFILLLLVLWWIMCCLRERQSKTLDIGNGNLDSSTIHSESNKNIKDRVQMSELKLTPKTDAEAYQDIQDVFLRPNKDKPKSNTATQTSQTSDTFSNNVVSTPSSHKDFVFSDPLRSSGRLSYCDSCSKSIDDDDMVNIFLNKMWIPDNNTNNDVKFEVVGKSMNQAKRFRIDEVDESSISTTLEQEKSTETPANPIPVRNRSLLKSEIFIKINDDSTVQTVDGNDDVFN